MTFPLVPLGELFDIRSGNPAPQGADAFGSDGIPFVRAGSLSVLLQGESERSLEKVSETSARRYRLNLFPAKTILFAKSGMSALKGHIYQLARPAYVVSHLAALTANQKVHNGYARWALQSYSPTRLVKDPAYPSIRLSEIEGMEIPLPPLDEQRRIAAILDRANELRQRRELALGMLENLPCLLFRQSFGDLVSNDRGWRSGTVSDLIEGFGSGKSLVAADEDDAISPFRVLKISSVTSLKFVPTETKALPRGYVPPNDHLVRRGDLLFSRANTSDLIGATALVDCDCEGLALPDKLWRFRWHADGRTDPNFVWQLFMEPSFRDQIRRLATGTSGSMKNISQDKVMGIEIGIPDPELQTEFALKFAELRGVIGSMRRQRETLDALFASLQHRAFSGQLTRSDERLLEPA